MPPPAQFSLVDSLKNEARSSEEPPADRQAQSECLALFNLIDEDRSGQISKKVSAPECRRMFLRRT
jgi:hypothetical protein